MRIQSAYPPRLVEAQRLIEVVLGARVRRDGAFGLLQIGFHLLEQGLAVWIGGIEAHRGACVDKSVASAIPLLQPRDRLSYARADHRVVYPSGICCYPQSGS
jgi:hypothetical protein